MPESQIAPSAYASLRNRVRQVLILGQQRIEAERVRTYWQTGKVINDYLSRYASRAEHYGREVVAKLSGDLEIGEDLLRRCVQFYRSFGISATWRKSQPELTWSHYRALMGIEDDRKREELLGRAVDEDWRARDLQEAINQLKRRSPKFDGLAQKSYEPLAARKGKLYTYRLIRHEKIAHGKQVLKIDLGFSCLKAASMQGAANLKEGQICRSLWVKGDTYRLKAASGSSDSDLFTYSAELERVVDGDTILAHVDLGFGMSTRQYLRLRGIDCPEIDTSKGRRAKKFVESELSSVPYVTICSTKSDKYDRYLADLFFETKKGGQFLNNRLLEEKLAVTVRS